MKDLNRFQWMSLKDVLRATSAMDKNNVSEVARGIQDSTQTKEGFVQAYIATKGNIDKMSKRKTGRKKGGVEKETWAERRNQFVSRHLTQMRKGDKHSDGWLPNGEPTDRHLGLMAWAYTPSPKRTKEWLETQPMEWKMYVSNPMKKIKGDTIKSAIHLIDSDGVNEKIGYVTFSDSPKGLRVDIDVDGLPDGEHGFHVHEYGNLEPKQKNGKWVAGLSAGQHFDPLDAGFHGHPDGHGHLGDLPFITVKNGKSKQTVYQSRLNVDLIRDRAIIIHECGDNYSDDPLPNGGGKSRIAGGIITNHCVYCKVKQNPFSAKALERILYQSYKRGVGAWKSGHRKGMSPQRWGNARVNSFLVGGEAFFTSDNDLAMKLPDDLYNAIVAERVIVPIPKSQQKVVRDKYGDKIQQKYLDGYEGKQLKRRIKEIEKRRKEYDDALEKYGSDANFPQKVLDKLYRGWTTDKGTYQKKSPYTIAAHKRGFTGSRLNKAKQAIKYYSKAKKNPSMIKEDFINQQIKWKRTKDFDLDGTYEATIDGKVYDIYRDNTSGMSSYPTWHGGDKTKKILPNIGGSMGILGYTKKEAVEKLLQGIWENKSKKEEKKKMSFTETEVKIIMDLSERFNSLSEGKPQKKQRTKKKKDRYLTEKGIIDLTRLQTPPVNAKIAQKPTDPVTKSQINAMVYQFIENCIEDTPVIRDLNEPNIYGNMYEIVDIRMFAYLRELSEGAWKRLELARNVNSIVNRDLIGEVDISTRIPDNLKDRVSLGADIDLQVYRGVVLGGDEVYVLFANFD